MKWKFKEGTDPININWDFWFDLTVGGDGDCFINLLKEQEQIKSLQQAINLVKDFEDVLIDKGLLVALT